MTTHRITTAIGLVLSAATIASACGGDGEGGSSSAADGTYCKTVRSWTAHELTTVDESDPAQLKRYIGEYVAFNTEAAEQAPAEIATDWKRTSAAFESTVVPVLEKYGYSVDRIMAEATPEEQAVQEPPPDLAAAQDRIHAYEARVCMSGQPAAADVSFAGPVDVEYCQAAKTLDDAADLSASEWSPESVKAFVTSPDVAAMYEAGVAAAPPEIHDDVAAIATFTSSRVVPMLERHGYDMRGVLVDGPVSDLAILQSWDPAIVDSYRRVVAYEDQLCGSE
jgi:hypothetical protein